MSLSRGRILVTRIVLCFRLIRVNDAKLVLSEFHALISFIVFKLYFIGRKNAVFQIEQKADGAVPNILIERFSSR